MSFVDAAAARSWDGRQLSRIIQRSGPTGALWPNQHAPVQRPSLNSAPDVNPFLRRSYFEPHATIFRLPLLCCCLIFSSIFDPNAPVAHRAVSSKSYYSNKHALQRATKASLRSTACYGISILSRQCRSTVVTHEPTTALFFAFVLVCVLVVFSHHNSNLTTTENNNTIPDSRHTK